MLCSNMVKRKALSTWRGIGLKAMELHVGRESLRVIIVCGFKVAVFSWMWGGSEKHPKYVNRWRLSSLKKLWYVSRFCINISKLTPKY